MKTTINNVATAAKKDVKTANSNPLYIYNVLNKLSKRNEFCDNTNLRELLAALDADKWSFEIFPARLGLCRLVPCTEGNEKTHFAHRREWYLGREYYCVPVPMTTGGIISAAASIAQARAAYKTRVKGAKDTIALRAEDLEAAAALLDEEQAAAARSEAARLRALRA